MTYCKLEIETKYLKDIIKTLKVVSDGVVKFELSTNGIHCLAVDEEHILLIDMSISGARFKIMDYNCQDVNLSIFAIDNFLKSCAKNSVVRIEKTEDDKIVLSCDSLKRTMNMVKPIDKVKRPDIKLDSFVSVSGKWLKDCIKQFVYTSSYFTFKLTNELFELYNKDEFDIVHYQLTNDEVNSKNLKEQDKTYCSHYETQRINKIFKVIPNDNITLWLDNDFPLRIYYLTCDNEAIVSFYLAPRIESE